MKKILLAVVLVVIVSLVVVAPVLAANETSGSQVWVHKDAANFYCDEQKVSSSTLWWWHLLGWEDGKCPNITICHATGSESNPYVENTVNTASTDLNGHRGHSGDIIPAPAGGCPEPPPPYVTCSETTAAYGPWGDWAVDPENEGQECRVRTVANVDSRDETVVCSTEDPETECRDLEDPCVQDPRSCVTPTATPTPPSVCTKVLCVLKDGQVEDQQVDCKVEGPKATEDQNGDWQCPGLCNVNGVVATCPTTTPDPGEPTGSGPSSIPVGWLLLVSGTAFVAGLAFVLRGRIVIRN